MHTHTQRERQHLVSLDEEYIGIHFGNISRFETAWTTVPGLGCALASPGELCKPDSWRSSPANSDHVSAAWTQRPTFPRMNAFRPGPTNLLSPSFHHWRNRGHRRLRDSLKVTCTGGWWPREAQSPGPQTPIQCSLIAIYKWLTLRRTDFSFSILTFKHFWT